MSEFDWVTDPEYRRHATERQLEFMDAVALHGSRAAAAVALGVRSASNVSDALRIVKEKAARQGHAPGHWTDGVAPGYAMGKVTVQRANGEVERTWERQSPTIQAQIEHIKAAVAGWIDGVGQVPVAPSVPGRDTDVIPWVQVGDGHLGMLAHEAETGANFDLKIAERELCAAIDLLVDEMGEHQRAVLNDLGDFTHYENFTATTEASGHALDADGRYPRMIVTYSRVMRHLVTKLLEKVDTLDVIVNQGNHSRTNDIWMAELLRVAFGHTGRVNVLNNASAFIAYRMGNTLVMTHHSDQCRPAKLAHVMATDYAADWGETEYRYIDIGHIHHNMVLKEHPGVAVESFNTLAPKDKWATNGGYRARQSITVVHRSRTYGEIGRRVLPIRQVRDAIVARIAATGGAPHYVPPAQRAFAV